jgi:hypothetical protein
MDKTNLSQDGIGRSLLGPSYLPLSQLMKRQVSDGAFALGARLAGREGVGSPFCPGTLPMRKTLLNLAVATLINAPVVAAGWLAQKSLVRGLTFGRLLGCSITLEALMPQSVRDVGKGSPCGYWRNSSRDAEHFTRPRRSKSSQ